MPAGNFEGINAKAALDRLKVLFGPKSKSQCAGAVDMSALRSMKTGPLASRLNISLQSDEREPRYISFGAGTTGTTWLFDIMCNSFNISGTHFHAYCDGTGNNVRGTTSSNWSLDVYNHMAAKRPTSTAAEKKALSDMVKSMLQGKNEGSFWIDSPVPQIFVDLIGLARWTLSMATYREPEVWVQRRFDRHSMEYMCHPRLWKAPGVLHPFDFIGCMSATSNVAKAFQFIKHIPRAGVKYAFVKMNTVNAYHALLHDIPFLPICIFDPDSGSAQNLTQQLEQHGVKHAFPQLS